MDVRSVADVTQASRRGAVRRSASSTGVQDPAARTVRRGSYVAPREAAPLAVPTGW